MAPGADICLQSKTQCELYNDITSNATWTRTLMFPDPMTVIVSLRRIIELTSSAFWFDASPVDGNILAYDATFALVMRDVPLGLGVERLDLGA